MEVKSGIYCIENIIDGKKYIGSSINLDKRRRCHFSNLKNNIHKNSKLQRSYNKNGLDSFIFYILEIVDIRENLIEKEQFYIDNLKPEYNINIIANSSLGVKRSEETKEKVRLANLGLKHPEWRNKIKSQSQGGDNHWTKKKNFSEESKSRMSESQKKLYKNGYIHPRKRKIIQYSLDMEFIKEWDSMTEAAIELEINKVGISNCLRGITKKSGNFIWRYL